MIEGLFSFLLSITQDLGYWGVGILMAIESSLVPLPSEIIVPPAAYLASQGRMNIWLVILFGVLGTLLGALINYALGYYLGRPLVYKLANHKVAKFLLITPEKIKKAEKYFFDNSASATFIGRLIPVIRQFVPIPAGFSKMPILPFIFYTILGSSLWILVLAALGYFLGHNQELLTKYYNEIAWVILILGVFYFSWRVFKAVNKKNTL